MATDRVEVARLRAIAVLRDSIWRKLFGVMVTRAEGRFLARAFSVVDGAGDFEEHGETELEAIEAVARHVGIDDAAGGACFSGAGGV